MSKINAPQPVLCSIADTIEPYERMFTIKEFSQLMAESPKTIDARVKHGSQPATLVGGAIRSDPYDTAQWLRSPSAKRDQIQLSFFRKSCN
jgi:hypothetical protein